MKNAFAGVNFNVDAGKVPNQLWEKIIGLVFPLATMWIVFTGLDKGRGFFEKNKYKKTVFSIYIIKIIFIILFLVYMGYLFQTGRFQS